jgi:hypothetical protein
VGLIDDAPDCRTLIERMITEARAIISGRLPQTLS